MQIPPKNKQQVIQLVQITDAHLDSTADGELLGIKTDESLAHVVSLAAKERGDIDVLLATGDLSNSGDESSYRRFRDLTQALAGQSLWLPGNHDLREVMQKSLDGGKELTRSTYVGNWQILMLDSAVKGQVGGDLTQSELDFLYKSLSDSANNKQKNNVEHVLICVHHHPINSGCAWLDEQKIASADAFFNVVDQFDHIRGILWGHIHQRVDTLRKGVRLMATPSTCIQFAPNSPKFKLDRLGPGYRWLELYTNGSIESDVSRIIDIVFNIDYDNSSGY